MFQRYGLWCDATGSFSDTAGVVASWDNGMEAGGERPEILKPALMPCTVSGMRPHGRVCKIWSSLQFPLAFLSGCYNHWSLGYLRHDAREMKHFSCYVWQVTVQEDKEWLNHSDFMGETGGKGCYKSQKDSNQYSTDPHYKEVSNSSEYINNLNCAHLAERLEQIVQDLWEKEKSTSCFWILFNFLLCYHVPLIQCWTLYFSIYLEHTFEICCCLLLTFVSSTNIREIYKEG